jgi:hypothetical protein
MVGEAREEKEESEAPPPPPPKTRQKREATSPKPGGGGGATKGGGGDLLDGLSGGGGGAKGAGGGGGSGGGGGDGSDERTGIRQVFSAAKPKLLACGEEPKASGKLIARVTIAASGEVTNVVITGDLAGTPAAECAAKVLRAQKFPSLHAETTVSYPFVLP